jgi:hypothetical protein
MRADAVLFLQYEDTPIGIALGDPVGRGQADNTGSYDGDVIVRSFGHAVVPVVSRSVWAAASFTKLSPQSFLDTFHFRV